MLLSDGATLAGIIMVYSSTTGHDGVSDPLITENIHPKEKKIYVNIRITNRKIEPKL